MDRSIDQLIKDAKTTLKNAQKRKKADRWEPMSVSLDGMIAYCEDMIELCEQVKTLEKSYKNPIEYPYQIHLAEKDRNEFLVKLRALIPGDLFEKTKLVTNEDASDNS